MHDVITDRHSLCTAEEAEAAAALRAVRPDLVAGYAPARARARRVHLEKLRAALDREGFAESLPPVLPTHPVALIDAVMGAREGRRRPEHWPRLRGEVAASVAAHGLGLVAEPDRRDRIAGTADTDNAVDWAARSAAADHAFSPLTLFEQSVIDGHPWHPSARMRVGMDFHESFAYSPEWVSHVPLGLLAVRPAVDHGLTAALRRGYPELAARADAWLAGAVRRPGDYALVPVHPWQLHHLVRGRYAEALSDGRIVVVPGAEIAARPLLSMRTLSPAHDRSASHLKTAMNVQLTSAVRIVSPAAVHNGPRLTRLLRTISAREGHFAGRFVVLRELAGAHYRPTGDEPAEAASALGAILRESPERYAAAGEVAMPMAALTARSPLRDRSTLVDVLECAGGSPRDAARRFLASLCDCALGPLFTLLSRWGVALEAHGQNTLVVLRDGLVTRVLYRDLGGVRVSGDRLARHGLSAHDIAGSLRTDSEDELRAKLLGALVSTGLGEVVPELSRAADVPAASLWELVARRCRLAYRPLLDDPAVREQAKRDLGALFAPTVPMKALLRMRLSEEPLTEQWIAAPNPLAEAA